MVADSAPQSKPIERGAFYFFERLTLRYADNDVNGHVNNAHYYAFFDTAVEAFLRAEGWREALAGEIMTPVVASSCRYFREICYPGQIEVGVKVGRVGTTSIQFDVAIFTMDGQAAAAAQGTFTTVCTSRQKRRPVAVPTDLRQRMASRPQTERL